MKLIYRGLAFAFLLCSAIFISFGVVASQSPDNLDNADVKEVREILDSWTGQSDRLKVVGPKIMRAVRANPQNYIALKELARYQAAGGYINQKYVISTTHSYTVGNFLPGSLETSEATIRSALRINPRFADGYVFLSYIQLQNSQLDEAAKSLTQAEALGTDDPWLHLNWAAVYDAKGEHSAAEKHWQKILQSGTTNINAKSSAYAFAIESYKRAGKHDKAIALFNEQIKQNPNSAWLRGNFAAYLSETLGRNDEAILQAREALKIMQYGLGERVLAMALFRKWADVVERDKDGSAEKYFQEASKIYPRLNDVMVYGASGEGGERLARELIAKKGISIDARVSDGSTALLVATNQNRLKIVKFLLDLKANPNISDDAGWTPLLSAADVGNAELVDLLLAKGADIRATLQGFSAAALAERQGHTALATMLKKRATKKMGK